MLESSKSEGLITLNHMVSFKNYCQRLCVADIVSCWSVVLMLAGRAAPCLKRYRYIGAKCLKTVHKQYKRDLLQINNAPKT